ncbi:uncharacterized protein LOC130440968 [Diorhabda sublineata]|uniref:uncharacterized protein LOC130440968 n=1 Tax=Diorhabda sublineata TaxID=1163346 RepID=UPI0024E056A0|nr:uncharacterized protein LOC130440968 [Diorhabda sublineata]
MKSKVLCANVVILVVFSVSELYSKEKNTFILDRKQVVSETEKVPSKEHNEISKTIAKPVVKYVCPEKEVSKPFFALPCSIKKDCDVFGRSTLCCDKRCIQGITPLVSKPKQSGETLNAIRAITKNENNEHSKILITLTAKYVCPDKNVPQPFFTLPCSTKKDCNIFGKSVLCCDKRCVNGVKPSKLEPTHVPAFFGFVQQICPKEPFAEIFEIKKCTSDQECSPRICCPETLKSGEQVSYCRTAQPLWEKIPAPRQLVEPIRALVAYMQCTPPPPPILDLFPKPCDSQLDCFPNLCCQERGKRYCRPPKKSLVTVIAGIGQRIIPTDAAKEFIKRIS